MKKRIQPIIDDELWRKLKIQAKAEMLSVSDFLGGLIMLADAKKTGKSGHSFYLTDDEMQKLTELAAQFNGNKSEAIEYVINYFLGEL